MDSAAADVVAIEQLLVRFLKAADEGPQDGVGACFLEAGSWRLGTMTWTGPEEISRGIADMRTRGFSGPGSGSRHIGSNFSIEVTGDEADAHSYFTLVHSGESGVAIRAVGAYRDSLARSPHGWRIRERTIA